MKVTPLSPKIGAVISDITLNAINDDEFILLYQAFLKYKVLFFREQLLTPEEHLAVGRRFGELAPIHPFFPNVKGAEQIIVIEVSKGNPPGKSYWHTDLTWLETPPKCSILHAQHIPESGGDTIWTSMEAVFDSLSEDEKKKLRCLSCLHALHAFEGSRYDKKDKNGASYVAEKSKEYPPVIHPMVVKHPETNIEGLFINEQYTKKIVELEDQESQALLNKLFAIARKEEFHVRFQWQPNSIAIWDNRCTQHFAVTDYGDQPRKMHRVTIKG
ncbi:TauD/TfdA family dioxygenase [Psychromonas sp.]|nr:TauD/TfdA family dioxygenase [Psychromonas sp.]